MSILDRGFFKLNPNSESVLKKPVIDDGYAAISNAFSKQEAKYSLFLGKIDDAIMELNKPVTVSADEVNTLLNRVYALADSNNVQQSILTPIFMSVIDGAMRSFKVSSKLGLTPSSVLKECEAFRYTNSSATFSHTDSLTESISEERSIQEFAGVRSLEAKDLRDHNKMGNYKKKHFNGETCAPDEYNPEGKVYSNNKEAFAKDGMTPEGKERHPESAETDHVVPCKVLCEQLKRNKALTDADIKEITNCDDNLAVTSRDTNLAKGGCTNSKFVEKHGSELSEAEKKELLDKERSAQKAIGHKQNQKVISNLCNDRTKQMEFAKDAGKNALCQAGGVLILYVLKPIYFEMKDSIQNGIEAGVSETSFADGLKTRFIRVKNYILESAAGQCVGSALDFLKSFVSVLIEAIIGCLTGIFKMIWRLVKEGFKIVSGAVKILADDSKSLAEKGDAILQLAGVSISAVAGIYIDGAVRNLGIPEPWSILLASVSSAVVASGILYLLTKLDVFNTRKEMRNRRILEILDEMNENVAIEAQEVDTQEYTFRSPCYLLN